MIEKEEYNDIKEIGQQIGYLFENSFDNLEDNYKLKSKVVDISKNYVVTRDGIFLKQQLHEIFEKMEIGDKLYQLIQMINNLQGEKAIVYSNSVYIPDDEEFIDNYHLYHNLNELSNLYHVPQTVIASKIFEINKYGKREEKSHHMT